MPNITANIDDDDDIRSAIVALQAILASRTDGITLAAVRTQISATNRELPTKVASLKAKGIWPFLSRAAALTAEEFSLPELGNHLGLSSAKVCSLKAILRKPEKRLAIKFFETAPSGTVDTAGNPRYRFVPEIKAAILAA